MQDPFPEVELGPAPLAHPIVKPRLLSPSRESDEISLYRPQSSQCASSIAPSKAGSSAVVRAKHESYNFTKSTILITNTGGTVNLPIPSDSKHDPLNWSRWKTAKALFAITLYSVVCLTAAQAASVVCAGIQREYGGQVSVVHGGLSG